MVTTDKTATKTM